MTPAPTPATGWPSAPPAADWPGPSRPPELASEITLTGVLSSVGEIAWNPAGTCLAYAVDGVESDQVQVRCQPDFCLSGRWSLEDRQPHTSLLWTPDGQAVLFIFWRSARVSSIGLGRMGETEWQDLLPGEKAQMGVNGSKDLVGWLDETTLLFTHGAGTASCEPHLLDVTTGQLLPLPKGWPVLAPFYFFSPDNRWVAANGYGLVFPQAFLWEWPKPAEAIRFSDQFGVVHSEAHFWIGNSLAVTVFPPGGEREWTTLPHPTLYLWDTASGDARPVAQGVYGASLAPPNDRLAVIFLGEPYVGEPVVETSGNLPYLGILDWPGGQLLAIYPLGSEEYSTLRSIPPVLGPVWSLDGRWLAFSPYTGGLLLMDREGGIQPIFDRGDFNWTDGETRLRWGSSGYLALVLDHRLWLLQVPGEHADGDG